MHICISESNLVDDKGGREGRDRREEKRRKERDKEYK